MEVVDSKAIHDLKSKASEPSEDKQKKPAEITKNENGNDVTCSTSNKSPAADYNANVAEPSNGENKSMKSTSSGASLHQSYEDDQFGSLLPTHQLKTSTTASADCQLPQQQQPKLVQQTVAGRTGTGTAAAGTAPGPAAGISAVDSVNLNQSTSATHTRHPITIPGLIKKSSTFPVPIPAATVPTVPVSVVPASAVPASAVPVSSGLSDVQHTMICREFKTESNAINSSVDEISGSSSIPEKDNVLWLIKDFAAFRSAAKISKIPPLMSPEFGGGCKLKLQLYGTNGHVIGTIELPTVKASRDGVAHFRISVVRPDMKAIVTKKVEMRISAPIGASDKKQLITQQRNSSLFKLTKSKCLGNAKYDRLIVADALRVRVEFQYFPFDSFIFRGFGRFDSIGRHSAENSSGGDNTNRNKPFSSSSSSSSLLINKNRLPSVELLNDIKRFCKDDSSQNVEIKCEDQTFNGCRFLLSARSKRFREIFGSPPPLSSRGSPSRFPSRSSGSSSMSCSPSLSSITINDITAESLDQLLSFIHTDEFPWRDDRTIDIIKVLDLFEASELYGVEALVQSLIVYLSERIDNDNFMFMYDVAERVGNVEFKLLCTEFMDSLPGSQVASLMRVNSTCLHTPRSVL